MSISLIYDTLILVALFIRYGMKMRNCGQNFHFRFCAWKVGWVQNTKCHSKRRWLTPPSIGDYLHGYTLSYQSYGSLWQLLGTGAWLWTRENVKKGQFFRKFWDRPWLFFIVLYVSCTCFILKCLKILKSRDHVSPACKPILANLKIHWKIKSHIWALSASHFLDQKNYPLPPSRKCQIFNRL